MDPSGHARAFAEARAVKRGERGGFVLPAALTAALLLAGWLSPRAVPYNMDEFVHYHALGCATAPQGPRLAASRDGCGLYDLRLPFSGTALPLRSYYYIGSFPSVPFYPFWRALDDPVAARVQGALFLAVFTLLAARLLHVRFASAAAAALLFPAFAASFVVDEGPVGLPACLLLLALLSLRRALAAGRPSRSLAWGSAAGLALFLGLWSKLVFASWGVAVALFAVAECRRRAESWRAAPRRCAPALLATVLALGLPSLALLASVDRDGRRYAATLERGRFASAPSEVAGRAAFLLAQSASGGTVAPRNVVLAPWPTDALPALLGAGLLAALLARGARRRQALPWLVAAAATLWIVAQSAFAQWPHHGHYALLLAVMALALAIDDAPHRVRFGVALGVAAVLAAVLVRLPAATHPVDSGPDKDALLRFVRRSGLDARTLQAHGSWGTYYVAQLFGDPARQIVYARALSDDARELEKVRELARDAGRPVLLLSSRRPERLYTDEVAAILGRPTDSWRFGAWSATLFAAPPP
jgi:hypothetical protein